MQAATTVLNDASLLEKFSIRQKDIPALIGIPKSSFQRDLAAGMIGPSARRLGVSCLFEVAELRAWISTPKPNGELYNRAEWPAVWAAIKSSNKRASATN